MPDQADPTVAQVIYKMQEHQQRIAKAENAREDRDAAAFWLWCAGLKQSDIASLLDTADRNAGGTGVSLTQVQKALSKYRRNAEQALLQQERQRIAGES
jgi:transposase